VTDFVGVNPMAAAQRDACEKINLSPAVIPSSVYDALINPPAPNWKLEGQ
jgi:hypothetical protein